MADLLACSKWAPPSVVQNAPASQNAALGAPFPEDREEISGSRLQLRLGLAGSDRARMSDVIDWTNVVGKGAATRSRVDGSRI